MRKTKTIDGNLFYDLLSFGFSKIRSLEKQINLMNVFPVPDGDTGTNMRSTVENGLHYAQKTQHLGDFSSKLSKGMLLGARGNSGVILSQYFKGIALYLAGKESATMREFALALEQGYKNAYKTVVNPTEGTMLTVAREGAEKVVEQITDDSNLYELLSLYLRQMEVTLQQTPKMLPALQEAGVVDSGGKGLCVIFKGAFEGVMGQLGEASDIEILSENAVQPKVVSHLPKERTDFGYCLEFILQIFEEKLLGESFDTNLFVSKLEKFGDSIAVCLDDDLLKAHIHTKIPERVIEYAHTFGEFITFKMENMTLQHSQISSDLEIRQNKKEKERAEIAYVTVCNGVGMRECFKELGCSVVIDAGELMNPPVQEILDAFKKANAKNIVFLPNDKNIFLTANEAKNMFDEGEVFVVETTTIAQAYFAMSMVVGSSKDIEKQLKNIKQGAESVCSLAVAKAERDAVIGGKTICKGKFVCLMNGELKSVENDAISALINTIGLDKELEDKEIMIVFKGSQVTDEMAEQLLAELDQAFPDIEKGIIDGGQSVYDFIVGLS